MYKRKGIILIILASLMALTVACSQEGDPVGDSEGLEIYTTFYPLYDFSTKIGGDKIVVENMVPVGVEAHDFEPSPKQIARLNHGDGLIFLGEPMDTWASKLSTEIESKGVEVLEAGKGLIENNDPHIWLDPSLAKDLSARILDMLIGLDTENEEFYRANYLELEKKFDSLDERYRKELKDIRRKDLVVSHAALGYMTKKYGLKQIPITGLSPQEEPSPKKMAELSKLVAERDIKYIFFEELASSKLSETLAEEVGAELLVFNPLDGITEEEMSLGEDYFTIMEKNLQNIKKALK